MINRYHVLLFLGLAAVSLMAVGAVNADLITIPDYSFETPDLSTGTPYTTDPTGADLAPWNGAAVSIYNVPAYVLLGYGGNVTNPDGFQVGYIANQVAQRPYLYQTLANTYQAGMGYELTVGACFHEEASMGGELLSLQLGYWSGTPDGNAGPTIVAERQIAASELVSNTLIDFTAQVNVGALPGDAVGQPIVVYIARATGGAVGARWSVDNVRLSEVPEPGTIVSLVSGLMGLAFCAWRKRK
jgi:hypothetical protein